MGRGRERIVRCEKCGRQTRRDKAVFYDKVMFTNPVERKDVHDETYVSKITKTVAYCPSCGKHLGIYEKKIKQAIAQKEREERRASSNFRRRDRPAYYENPDGTAVINQPAEPAKPSPQAEAAPGAPSAPPAREVPADEESEEMTQEERDSRKSQGETG